MANDMRLDLNFVDHRKVKRLIRMVGYEAFYRLLRLFSIAGRIYQNGYLKGCDGDDIEALSEWSGDPSVFTSALVTIGFIDEVDGGYQIHDWEQTPAMAQWRRGEEQ